MNRADALRDRSQWKTRILNLPSGPEVVIRFPKVRDLVDSGLGPLVAQILPPEQEAMAKRLGGRWSASAKAEDIPDEEVEAKTAAFCALILMDPPLHLGDDPCPEGSVTLEDLGEDINFIFDAAFTWYATETEAAKRAVTFRVDANREAGQSSSATLQEAPNGDHAPVTG